MTEALTDYTNSTRESQKNDHMGVDEETRLQIEIEMLEGMAKERDKGDY